ncbi:MAG: ATP synthase F1 subunit delta [Acidobacteriota bacterium]
MKSEVVARRYAMGLVRATSSEKEWKIIHGELNKILEIFKSSEELISFLESPFFPRKIKGEVLKKIGEYFNFSEKTKNFLYLVEEKGRVNLLKEIVMSYEDLWYQKKAIHKLEIYSAFLLKTEQKKQIIAKLEKILKGKIISNFKTDPSIIGGLKIKKGNVFYDGTIKGNLIRLKDRITGEKEWKSEQMK